MTTIGTSLVITGEVTSREDITIHGQVKGAISMVEGSLLVAPTARLDADVDDFDVLVFAEVGNANFAEFCHACPARP